MTTLDEKLELHRMFWEGRLARPLLGFFLPGGPRTGLPGIDVDTPAEAVVRKCRIVAEWQRSVPGDRVPEVSVNYGTSFLAALAGAECRHDGHTSWALPRYGSAEEVEVPPFDRDAPPWRGYEEKLRALAGAGIEGAVVATGARTGPMDMLAALLGPQTLCTQMLDAPEAVERKAAECTRFWIEVFEAQWEALGRPSGNAGFGVYVPGRSSLWSEDAFALVGPAQFGRFFRPAIAAVAEHLEVAFLHTHSGGAACYPLLGGIEDLRGIEISNDPNGPPVAALARAGAEFQARGKSVMFSNWNRPLDGRELDQLLGAIDPSRSLITLTVSGREEAEGIIARVGQMFGERA